MARRSNRLARKERQKRIDAAVAEGALNDSLGVHPGVAPGHAAMPAAIRVSDREVKVTPDDTVWKVTGPGLVAEFIEDGRMVRIPYTRDKVAAPAWTISAHDRLGHVGGAALFVALMLLAWPLGLSLLFGFFGMVAVYFVTAIPGLILENLQVNPAVVMNEPDRFVFSWLYPALFGILVAAGLSVMMIKALFVAAVRWSKLLALGLFRGYGRTVRQDRLERKVTADARKAEREAARAERKAAAAERKKLKAEVADAIAAEDSAASGKK